MTGFEAPHRGEEQWLAKRPAQRKNGAAVERVPTIEQEERAFHIANQTVHARELYALWCAHVIGD